MAEIHNGFLRCRRCRVEMILAPLGATPHTRFLCRKCCGRAAAKKALAAEIATEGNASDPTLVRIERLARAVSAEQLAA